MEHADQQVLEKAIHWLGNGHRVFLAMVLQTWGSSPRPAGSLLTVRDDGLLEGSVSGGCIEEDLVGRLTKGDVGLKWPWRRIYGVDGDEARRLGLPCGGRLEVLVECLTNTDTIAPIVDAMQQRRLMTRSMDLTTGHVVLKTASLHTPVFEYNNYCCCKVFGPVWQLLLIGAGQISHYVALMAQALGYGVLVCDPRDNYSANWDVPGTMQVAMMPDDIVRERIKDERWAVVALTHDPRLDDMALMEALESPAFYVGALGSRMNNKKRLERLATLGISSNHLSRLHGPVGLPIGSHTPAEIAIAILAEMTAVRHGRLYDVRSVLSQSSTVTN